MKRIGIIFLLAFLLNVVWENLHAGLYVNYMGGEITEFILLRASLFDAIVIMAILLPFLYWSAFKTREWLIVVVGTIIAIINEWYGLSTGRWVYDVLMPILPIIHTGITPTLQLGLLAFVVFKIQKFLLR